MRTKKHRITKEQIISFIKQEVEFHKNDFLETVIYLPPKEASWKSGFLKGLLHINAFIDGEYCESPTSRIDSLALMSSIFDRIDSEREVK